MKYLPQGLAQWHVENILKCCRCHFSNNKEIRNAEKAIGKEKLLNSVLWKSFNSHYIAHISKVPGFKINDCTI